MSLPDPRRVIIAHDTTTGAPIVSDEVLPAPGPGQLARQAFVQTAIPGNPNEGVVGKDEKPDLGFIRRGGVSVAYLDFAPGQEAPMHYTTSIDYLVVIAGEIELSAHDGTKKKLAPGDLIVQLAAAHSSKNVGDGPARLLAISLPSEEVKINGKTIAESGIQAMKLF